MLFSILFIFIFCFVFIKLINITNIKVRRQDNSYNKIFYSILKTILIICIIFILLDILKLLIFWYNNYTNFNIDTRSLLYENFLNKRLTYIKIAIIISVFLFKTDKALSSLGFLSIIVLDLITFSRFNIAILGIVFLLNNFIINKKNILSVAFITIIFFSYRPISQFILSDYKSFEDLIKYYATNAPGEFYAVFSTLLIFIDNYLTLGKVFLKLSTFLNMILYYMNDNINFLLKDFFYYSGLDLYNYWDHQYIKNSWANHGATYLMAYPLVLFLYFYVLKKLILSLVNQGYYIDFFKIIISYSLAMSFRGNLVHELGFLIKLIVLITLINFLTKLTIKIYNKKIK